MDAKIQRWKSLPATLSEFVCAVPLSAIECKALAGILPEQCPRLEQIQLSLETDAAGAQHLLDMLPCFILLSSLHIDISNTTDAATLQHVARTLTHKDIQILSRLELGGCHDKSVTFSSQCFPHILPFFQSPSIQYLRYLDFGCMSGLSLGSDGMRLLSPCLPRMQMLQQLGLNRNDIGDAGVETLCLALHQVTSLVSLNLEHNAITHRGCKVLAIAITPLSMLQRLFLCGNGIAARGVRELAPAIVSLSASNLHSSSCIQASSGGGSFEVSLEEELMNVLQLASARWKHGKLQEWRVFVQDTVNTWANAQL